MMQQRKQNLGTATTKFKYCRSYFLLLIILVLGLVSGCSIQVPIDGRQAGLSGLAKPYSRDLMPLKARLLSPKDTNVRIFQAQGVVWIGALHQWDFDVKSAVERSSTAFFNGYFHQVDAWPIWKDQEDAYDVMIKPEIARFDVSEVTMVAEVTLNFTIMTNDGVYLHEVQTQGKAPLVSGLRLTTAALGLALPLVGDVIGRYALSESAESAFEDAFIKLANHLDAELLAGHIQLSQDKLAVTFGRYQYAAEQWLAKGRCSLSSGSVQWLDGHLPKRLQGLLNSTSSKAYGMYSEYYRLICPGTAPFFVQCQSSFCELV